MCGSVANSRKFVSGSEKVTCNSWIEFLHWCCFFLFITETPSSLLFIMSFSIMYKVYECVLSQWGPFVMSTIKLGKIEMLASQIFDNQPDVLSRKKMILVTQSTQEKSLKSIPDDDLETCALCHGFIFSQQRDPAIISLYLHIWSLWEICTLSLWQYIRSLYEICTFFRMWWCSIFS